MTQVGQSRGGDAVGDDAEVELVPVEADGQEIALEAVVLQDGEQQRDLSALVLALREAADRLGDDLLFVSIDLGGVQVVRDQVADVVRAVRESDVPPSRVVLQIDVRPATAPYVGRALGPLRRAGIQVAVHEVVPPGECRCTSLAVDLAWVKVHACALNSLGTPRTDDALRQLVECTRGIEAEPIATGVRTDEQAQQLTDLGIRVQQRAVD